MKQKKPLQLIIQDQSRLDQLLKDHMSRTSKIQFREVSVYSEYIIENPKKVTNQALSVYRDMRPKYAKLFMQQWKYIVIQKSMNPYSDNVMVVTYTNDDKFVGNIKLMWDLQKNI
jgi:hypothetical protein